MDISICIVPVAIILFKEISEYRRLKYAAKILGNEHKLPQVEICDDLRLDGLHHNNSLKNQKESLI